MSFGSLPSVLGNGGGVAISVIGGTGLFADGTAAAPSISFASQTNKGFYHRASNQIGLSLAGSESLIFTTGGGLQGTSSNGAIFNSSGGVSLFAGGTNQSITLTPSGNGSVEIAAASITGTNAATFNVISASSQNLDFRSGSGSTSINLLPGQTQSTRFLQNGRILVGTTTDSANGILQLASSTAASGGIGFGADTSLYRVASGQLVLDSTGSDSALQFRLSGVVRAQVSFDSTNLYVGTLEVGRGLVLRTGGGITALTLDASQNATFAGAITAGATYQLKWAGRSTLKAPSDGVVSLLNNAETDFTRLQFGGTTASFPALARSGTNLLVTDATGGSYTPILAATFWATGPAVTVSAGNVSYGGTTATTVGAAGGASALPATPLGYIIVNVAGTPAKLPYYAA